MVKIQLNDINDNRPVFYPQSYNVSIRDPSTTQTTSNAISTPILTVIASDPDSERFGALTYRITSGNEAGLFRLERSTGELYISRPNMLTVRGTQHQQQLMLQQQQQQMKQKQSVHILNISASDGGGLRSQHDATVYVNIIDATQRPPIFEKLRYNFYVKEDVQRGTIVGNVQAVSLEAGE